MVEAQWSKVVLVEKDLGCGRSVVASDDVKQKVLEVHGSVMNEGDKEAQGSMSWESLM